MFIALRPRVDASRFGRADNQLAKFQLKIMSARPTAQKGCAAHIYKHLTPNGVTDCFVFLAILKLNCHRKAQHNGC